MCLPLKSLPPRGSSSGNSFAGPGNPAGPPSKRQYPSGRENQDPEYGVYELDSQDIDERIATEDVELDIGEASATWERPAAPELRPTREGIGSPLYLSFSVLSPK